MAKMDEILGGNHVRMRFFSLLGHFGIPSVEFFLHASTSHFTACFIQQKRRRKVVSFDQAVALQTVQTRN